MLIYARVCFKYIYPFVVLLLTAAAARPLYTYKCHLVCDVALVFLRRAI